MRLEFSSEFEDLAFVLEYLDPVADLKRVSAGVRLVDNEDVHEGLDDVLAALYRAYEPKNDHKAIREAKRLRAAPEVRKVETSILSLIAFYGLYRLMVTEGTLKSKVFIDQMAAMVSSSIRVDVDFRLLDIQVGEIASIEDVPGLDKLYSEDVIARERMRVLSGLREHVEKEHMLGNKFLFVTNMKPAKFKGQTSEGMILCVKDRDGRIEPIQLPRETGNGLRLELEGCKTLLKDFSSGKVDMKKSGYANALGSFRIVNHFLTFKGIKVTCGGEYVRTKAADGPVS